MSTDCGEVNVPIIVLQSILKFIRESSLGGGNLARGAYRVITIANMQSTVAAHITT